MTPAQGVGSDLATPEAILAVPESTYSRPGVPSNTSASSLMATPKLIRSVSASPKPLRRDSARSFLSFSSYYLIGCSPSSFLFSTFRYSSPLTFSIYSTTFPFRASRMAMCVIDSCQCHAALGDAVAVNAALVECYSCLDLVGLRRFHDHSRHSFRRTLL